MAFAETSGPVRITQYQITSLTPGTTYYVQVYARVNGQYTVGGALPLTVTAQLDRARIVNPQEELDAFATNGILRWSPVTGATAYELWIFTNPNSSEIYESSGSLTPRSYQTRTLQPGKVYYAQAYALVNGQWQVGAPVKITTTTTPTKARLTTPQEELEAFSTTGTLRWTEVPGATAYELWIYSQRGPRHDRRERGESRSLLHDAAAVQRRGVLRAGVRAGERRSGPSAGRHGST